MTDGVIKGTGNSRYLKTVADALSRYPTWQDGLAAMIAGTFPIDLYGINDGGWQTRGIDLNKASLLTDAVETAIWGSAANRTVSAALQQLRSLISTAQSAANSAANTASGRAIVVAGQFTGTAGNLDAGESATQTITVSNLTTIQAVFVGLDQIDGSNNFSSGAAAPGYPMKILDTTVLSVSGRRFSVTSHKYAANNGPFHASLNSGTKKYIAFGT